MRYSPSSGRRAFSLPEFTQSTVLMEQAAGVGRVANEAGLTGKTAGAYEITGTNERVLWDGNTIVPGSRGPLLLAAGVNQLPTPAGATGNGAKFALDRVKTAFRVEVIEPGEGSPTDDQMGFMAGRNPADSQWAGPMTVGLGRANLMPAVYSLANGHNNSTYGVASFGGGAGTATGNPADPLNASGSGAGYCTIAYGKNVLGLGAKGSAFGENTRMLARAGSVSGYYSQAGDDNGQDIGNQAHGYRARSTGAFAGAGGGAWGANIWARHGDFVTGSGLNESNPYASREDVLASWVSVLRGKPILAGVLQSDYITVWNGYGTDKPTQKHDLHIKNGERIAITLAEAGGIGATGRLDLQGLDNNGNIITLGRIEYTNENGGGSVSTIKIFTSFGGLRALPSITLNSDGTVEIPNLRVGGKAVVTQ